MPAKTSHTFRLTVAEADILFGHAEMIGRTQSDIPREFIRSLASQGKEQNPKSRAVAKGGL